MFNRGLETVNFAYLRWRLISSFPIAALVFLAVSGSAIFFFSKVGDSFKAEAKLLIEASRLPKSLSQSLGDSPSLRHLQIIKERLENREVTGNIQNELVEKQLDAGRSQAQLQDAIYLKPAGGRDRAATLLISVKWPEPEGAQLIANRLVAFALSESQKMRNEQAQGSLEVFEESLAKRERELTSIYQNIRELVLSHPWLLAPEEEEPTIVQSMPIETSDPMSDRHEALLGRVDKTKFELDTAMTRLSKQHPTVLVLQRQLKSQLAELDQIETSLSLRESTSEQVSVELPSNEPAQAMARLEYTSQMGRLDIVQNSLENARKQFIEAELAARSEFNENFGRLRLLEMAALPENPVGLSPKIRMAGTAIFALLFAILAAQVWARRDRTIRRVSDLEAAFGVQAYGVIPEFRGT